MQVCKACEITSQNSALGNLSPCFRPGHVAAAATLRFLQTLQLAFVCRWFESLQVEGTRRLEVDSAKTVNEDYVSIRLLRCTGTYQRTLCRNQQRIGLLPRVRLLTSSFGVFFSNCASCLNIPEKNMLWL